MHHWVKYCVNRCMQSEVIALTSFETDGRTDGRLAFLCPPPPNGFAMAGDKNILKLSFQNFTFSTWKITFHSILDYYQYQCWMVQKPFSYEFLTKIACKGLLYIKQFFVHKMLAADQKSFT